jgi:5-methylcytosine-specific restriction protein B
MAQELDLGIIEELKATCKAIEEAGELLTRDQLARYFATFRARFGPDRLKSLNGPDLLETMHSHGNKDSLVYWLEFKDDDEFPSPQFGSISGGSAYKFGLFRKRETGKWVTGAPQNEQELTLEQAIEKATQHRDQLLKGVDLLDKLPVNGTDEDYQRLQEAMDRDAPDVSNLAWGHKYLYLISSDKLDDFHNPDYQRFHLLRLLQLPPQQVGRYVAAGRFVALADLLAIPMNNLTAAINKRDGGTPYTYWRIGTTAGSDQQSYWEMMRQGNCVAVGWSQVGDLSEIPNTRAGKDQIRETLLAQGVYQDRATAGRIAQQLFQFRCSIAPNDLVLASNGATVLGVGRVIGPYRYVSAHDFPHQLPVEWLSLDSWQQPDQQPDIEGKLTTVHHMTRARNLLEAERRIFHIPPPPPTGPISAPPPRLQPIPMRIQAVLERKGQVILYGPPGTGKTYWAEQAARQLAARSRFGVAFEQLTQEQQAQLLGDGNQACGNVRLCSFHPAYGYEDFLEGFRPVPVNGQMHFILRDGIFKTLCKDAAAQPAQDFYLIIDEINRGDIPRIFGELLTVLEKDKRGRSILLPLTGTPFMVPPNVFLIGTMNTADRSIALLDTALRRRFGFIELIPDYTVLGNATVEGIPLGLWLKALNERICTNVGRDARNLQIGHSYLLEHERPIGDLATFAKVLQEDILPLLEEYCYEDYAILEKILGSSLVDVQGQRIREELFEPSNRSLLVQALLAPTPDLMTSATALSSAAEAVEEEGEEDGEDAAGGQP